MEEVELLGTGMEVCAALPNGKMIIKLF